MIRFALETDDGPVFGLGISEENVRRLKAGQPIRVSLDEMGGDGVAMIFYGETERDLVDMIADGIGPDTDIIT